MWELATVLVQLVLGAVVVGFGAVVVTVVAAGFMPDRW